MEPSAALTFVNHKCALRKRARSRQGREAGAFAVLGSTAVSKVISFCHKSFLSGFRRQLFTVFTIGSLVCGLWGCCRGSLACVALCGSLVAQVPRVEWLDWSPGLDYLSGFQPLWALQSG